MGCQFFRLQTYGAVAKKGSKSHSADSVLAEAMRVEGHAPHVPKPREPQLLFGDLNAIGDEIARLAREGRAEVALKDGRKATRKLHSNAPTLAAAVLSYPGRCDALINEWRQAAKKNEKPPASYLAFEKWKALALDFCRAEWGDRFQGAIIHWDEGHPHIHAYAIARQRADGIVDLTGLHPGRDAKEKARSTAEKGETPKEAAARQQAAYVDAMKALQDRYQESVGKRCAQARFGPKRRRMSRGEWTAEKERLRAEAAMIEKIEQQAAKIAQLEAEKQKLLNPLPEGAAAFMAPPPLNRGPRFSTARASPKPPS